MATTSAPPAADGVGLDGVCHGVLPTRYVVLVSGGDCPTEFVVEREVAEQSRMLRDQLCAMDDAIGGGAEGHSSHHREEGDDASRSGAAAAAAAPFMPRIELDDFPPPVLNLVVQFLSEKRATAHLGMSEFKQLKALDPKKEEDRRLVLELFLAADYLDC